MAEIIQTKIFTDVDELNHFCEELPSYRIRKIDSHLLKSNEIIFIVHYETNTRKSIFNDSCAVDINLGTEVIPRSLAK